MATVERIRHVLAKRQELTTLEQRFRFDAMDASAIVELLLTAPLVGSESIFGDRPGDEGPRTQSTRTLRRFSPAPGFRFDVDLERRDPGVFRVRFSQPDRDTPYLAGEFSWTITNHDGAAMFDEQINTEHAFRVAREPLTGPRPSLRRWLFFRAGHVQVMRLATGNIASLV